MGFQLYFFFLPFSFPFPFLWFQVAQAGLGLYVAEDDLKLLILMPGLCGASLLFTLRKLSVNQTISLPPSFFFRAGSWYVV